MKKIKTSRVDGQFYNQDCEGLARALLGKVICRCLPSGEIISGYIVETEAYLGFIDKSAHSYNGRRTERNEPMYMEPGTCYVYITYGMYHCFNISSKGDGSAVLIRALQPLQGVEKMIEFRVKGRKTNKDKKFRLKELCNGPAKLCISLNITKENINKLDLITSDAIWLQEPDITSDIFNKTEGMEIVKSSRIGIESAGEEWSKKLLRFYIKDNIFVSKRDKNEVIAT